MITQELTDYINKSRSSGMSDSQIRQQLSDQGWSSSDLDQAFNPVATPINEPPVPSPSTGTPIKPISLDLRGTIVGQYILLAVSILVFLPLYSGFLSGFLSNYFNASSSSFAKTQAGFVSAVIFIAFMLVLIIKILTQTYLISKINSIAKNPSLSNDLGFQDLIVKFRKSYGSYVTAHIFIWGALIPFIQLLAIWISVPIGFCLIVVYADRKFFHEVSDYISVKQGIKLGTLFLDIVLVFFFITLLLIIYGLIQGLNAI